MMLAGERFQALCKTYEAHGEGAVLKNLAYLIVIAKLVRIQPYALTHKEREVLDFLLRLNLES